MYWTFAHFVGALDMVSAYTMAFGGICASATLHLDLINNTLRGPLLFFERTPLGRILNRFTEDMATIDFVMPFTIRSMINCVLQMTGTLCVIGVTTPICLATVPPLALLYYGVQVLPVARHENRSSIVKPWFLSQNHSFILIGVFFILKPLFYFITMVLFDVTMVLF